MSRVRDYVRREFSVKAEDLEENCSSQAYTDLYLFYEQK
jgi:hypothetical protein